MYEMESVRRNQSLRVGIYLRLSDEDRDKNNKEDDSESIKNQRHLLLQEISKREDFIYVDEYCDEDLSGAGTYRPQFERLIKDCESHKLDVVLCKSQSRFSRDMEIIEKYLHNKFKEWGVRFISVSDNADTSNVGNKKSRQINGLVNEWFLEDVSNNIRYAFSSKMEQEEFISPFAPYGYLISDKDNNKLVVDPVASVIVKEIFNLYLKGMGCTAIARYLNDKNIPCPSLYKMQNNIKLNVNHKRPINELKWNDSAIRTILKNEVYIGNLVQGKSTTVSYKNHKKIRKAKLEWVRVENTHEAIIDKETFNKVQIAMKERTGKPSKATNCIHIFSGKVFCLECGHILKKNTAKGISYLKCRNTRDGYMDCENTNGIRYDVLEKLVIDSINKKLDNYYDKDLLEEKTKTALKNQFNEKLKALENQKINLMDKVRKTKEYLKSLYEDKVNGLITIDQFKDLMLDYNKSNEIYNEKIVAIDEEINHYKLKEQTSIDSSKILNKYKQLKSLNKIIIDEFIDKIYVGKLNKETKTRDIQIKWNFN